MSIGKEERCWYKTWENIEKKLIMMKILMIDDE
jgi:hypothetical protein